MLSLKTDYHPIEAALHWCGLTDHASEILAVAFSDPNKLIGLFQQWPHLHSYTERIYDAIACGELSAWYLGRLFRPDDQVNRAYLTVRCADLRIWVTRFYPDDKPRFLFAVNDEHMQCVSLGTYLAQKSERDAAERELMKMRQTHVVITTEMQSQISELQTLVARLSLGDIPSDQSAMVLYVIIGSVLAVTVGKSPDGQVQSIYKNQSALVDEINRRLGKIPGLSKSTLDRKFAEARRCLEQAG